MASADTKRVPLWKAAFLGDQRCGDATLQVSEQSAALSDHLFQLALRSPCTAEAGGIARLDKSRQRPDSPTVP